MTTFFSFPSQKRFPFVTTLSRSTLAYYVEVLYDADSPVDARAQVCAVGLHAVPREHTHARLPALGHARQGSDVPPVTCEISEVRASR